MERGYYNSLLEINGNLIGFNFGSDFTSEHEIGINGIQLDFGVGCKITNKLRKFFGLPQKPKYGLDRRIISICPSNLFWLENDKWEGIYYNHYLTNQSDIQNSFNKYTLTAHLMENEEFLSFWDDKSFCIAVPKSLRSLNEKLHILIFELFNAFKFFDVAIWLGSVGSISNNGLTLAIASKLPKEITDEWRNVDIDDQKLHEEVKKSGIKLKLKEAGKDFYALRPRRQEDGSIKFLLNPADQKKYNFGWYTFDELEQWIKNEGPIIKL